MPKPRRDPYVAVDATIRRNAKLAALPSDTARLGWLYVGLGEAKLQRPAGRFASRAHWAEVAGRFGRYLGDYLSVGLLEEAPHLCDRCRAGWGELPAGALIVHDWKRHQTDPGAAERAEAWRENDDRTAKDTPSNDERPPTERGLNGLSRARTRDPAGPRAANRKRREERERSESQVPTAVPARKAARPSRVREFSRAGDIDLRGPLLDARQAKAWESFGPEWDGVKAAWLGRGLRYPPSGSVEDEGDDSQRSILWQILDAAPADLPRWIAEAPKGLTGARLVGYLLERWHEARDVSIERSEADEIAWLEAKGDQRAPLPDATAVLVTGAVSR